MPEDKVKLMEHRLGIAKQRLKSAKLLLDNGKYKDSIGRSYYAMFTSIRALFAVEGIEFSKQAGAISYFQEKYARIGILDMKYAKYISQAFQMRNNAEYADFYAVSKKDARIQYTRAKDFFEAVRKYLMQSQKGEDELNVGEDNDNQRISV